MSQSALLARHFGIPAVVGAAYCKCGPSCVACAACTTNASSAVLSSRTIFAAAGCKCGCCLPADFYAEAFLCTDGTVARAGDIVTVDGSNGVIYSGDLKKSDDSNDTNFRQLLQWAMQNKRLKTFVSTDSIVSLSSMFLL